jgi:hypothetical protein
MVDTVDDVVRAVAAEGLLDTDRFRSSDAGEPCRFTRIVALHED